MIVKDYMTTNLITVSVSATFEQIAQLFYDHTFDAFPVVDEEMNLLGIISRTDLIKVFVPAFFDTVNDGVFVKHFGDLEIREDSIKTIESLFLVDDLMVTQVITVEENETLLKAITLMIKNRIRTLPVVKGKKIVGIISRTDILKAFLTKKKVIRET
jgi:CBS domain-containing protein